VTFINAIVILKMKKSTLYVAASHLTYTPTLHTKSLLTVDTERSKKLAKEKDKNESKQKL
jgi:hypothetical protein